MILKFKQHFDKQKQKPTYFAEKILKMYALNEFDAGNTIAFWELTELNKNDKSQYKNYINYPAKLHTIRTDNRWKSNNKIHCVYHNRSKKQFQFCPTFYCTSVQSIEINVVMGVYIVTIDGVVANNKTIDLLAINDGFDSCLDFFEYFNSDFVGKIIHFTDFRY